MGLRKSPGDLKNNEGACTGCLRLAFLRHSREFFPAELSVLLVLVPHSGQSPLIFPVRSEPQA